MLLIIQTNGFLILPNIYMQIAMEQKKKNKTNNSLLMEFRFD